MADVPAWRDTKPRLPERDQGLSAGASGFSRVDGDVSAAGRALFFLLEARSNAPGSPNIDVRTSEWMHLRVSGKKHCEGAYHNHKHSYHGLV